MLKLNDLRPSLQYFAGVRIVRFPSSMFSTVLKRFGCPARKGLTRQYTLMFPEKTTTEELLSFPKSQLFFLIVQNCSLREGSMIYPSGPALDCITCGFLQGLSGILKQHELDLASASLLQEIVTTYMHRSSFSNIEKKIIEA